ncbi:helix-turn-helix domain-containing protein [Streptomyces sp. NPDC058701]|uniref:helix-turn-helix domain-containing protein n=1 Tax=Streptomyces sp. NPDC058701 TaxID=3346608 RepID=UPI0036624A4B
MEDAHARRQSVVRPEGPGAGAAGRLGTRLQAARIRLSLTLDGLAQRSGLSKSFLSQLESGKANPTLDSLQRLAEAVETPLSVLLGGGPPAPGRASLTPPLVTTHRPARESRQWPAGEGRTYPLTGIGSRRFEAVLAEGTPAHHAFPTTHAGEELCVVLAGQVEAEVGAERFVMEAGETLHYDGGVPHRIAALDAHGRFLLVVAGPAAGAPRRV